MFTLAEIKSSLHQQVANTEDKKVLQKVQHYLRSLSKSKRIVAYDADLNPLTVEQYRIEIKKSIAQYKRGKVISQKEMEQGL
jgi:two-component sensor histidine kinase